jgi:hypothetical protein
MVVDRKRIIKDLKLNFFFTSGPFILKDGLDTQFFLKADICPLSVFVGFKPETLMLATVSMIIRAGYYVHKIK